MSYTSKQTYKRNRSAQEPEGLPKTPLKVQDNQEQEEQKSELDSQKGDGDDEASVASTSSPSKKKKKDKKDKKKVVVQQATYQMKELGGLVFKKIQDFEHGLRQLAATEVEYKVSQFIPKNQQSTLDACHNSFTPGSKFRRGFMMEMGDGTATGGNGLTKMFQDSLCTFPPIAHSSVCGHCGYSEASVTGIEDSPGESLASY